MTWNGYSIVRIIEAFESGELREKLSEYGS
jgi:hypothetical protein